MIVVHFFFRYLSLFFLFTFLVPNTKPSDDTNSTLDASSYKLTKDWGTEEQIRLIESAIDAFNLEDFHLARKQDIKVENSHHLKTV